MSIKRRLSDPSVFAVTKTVTRALFFFVPLATPRLKAIVVSGRILYLILRNREVS